MVFRSATLPPWEAKTIALTTDLFSRTFKLVGNLVVFQVAMKPHINKSGFLLRRETVAVHSQTLMSFLHLKFFFGTLKKQKNSELEKIFRPCR